MTTISRKYKGELNEQLYKVYSPIYEFLKEEILRVGKHSEVARSIAIEYVKSYTVNGEENYLIIFDAIQQLLSPTEENSENSKIMQNNLYYFFKNRCRYEKRSNYPNGWDNIEEEIKALDQLIQYFIHLKTDQNEVEGHSTKLKEIINDSQRSIEKLKISDQYIVNPKEYYTTLREDISNLSEKLDQLERKTIELERTVLKNNLKIGG